MTGTVAGDLILSCSEKIYIKSGSSTTTPAIKIDKNNNVSIVTLLDNPAYKLQVEGDVYLNKMLLNTTEDS